jgi:hypothetical protein
LELVRYEDTIPVLTGTVSDFAADVRRGGLR